jgi:hypothetical protein
MKHRLFVLGLAALVGCISPQSATQKLTDSAYEVAMATRFGRMDILIQAVRPASRDAFIAAHSGWDSDMRILDVELTGIQVVEPGVAHTHLTVSWHRMDEATLRTSVIRQTWTNGDDAWAIDKEEISSGDKGLLDDDAVLSGKKKVGTRSALRATPDPL